MITENEMRYCEVLGDYILTEPINIGLQGVVASGIAFAVQIWCIDRGGPVFVAVYQPVQTLVVAIMASIALGEQFYLGGSVLFPSFFSLPLLSPSQKLAPFMFHYPWLTLINITPTLPLTMTILTLTYFQGFKMRLQSRSRKVALTRKSRFILWQKCSSANSKPFQYGRFIVDWLDFESIIQTQLEE